MTEVDDQSAKYQPLIKKRIIFGKKDSNERTRYPPPPPPPPKGTYPRKPPFWQTRGTKADVYRSGIAGSVVLGGLVIGGFIMYYFDSSRKNMLAHVGIKDREPDEIEQEFLARRVKYLAERTMIHEGTHTGERTAPTAEQIRDKWRRTAGVYSHTGGTKSGPMPFTFQMFYPDPMEGKGEGGAGEE